MADDGPSAAEDATATAAVAAASELGDGDSRVTRERHKRADATTPIATTPTPGQDASSAKRGHEDASSIDDHYRSPHDRRVHHRHHQHHSPRHSYHHPPPPSPHHYHHHHHHHHFNPHRHHLTNHRDNDSDRVGSNHDSGGSSISSGGGGDDSSSCVDATGTAASDDEKSGSGSGGVGIGVGVDGSGSDDGGGSGSVGLYRRDDVRIEVVRSVVSEDDDDDEDDDGDGDDDDDDYYDGSGGVDSDCDGDSAGRRNNISGSKSGAGGVALIMTGGNNNNAAMRVGVEGADGATDSSSSSPRRSSADGAPEVNDREDRDGGRRRASVAVVATTTREAKPMAEQETRVVGEDAAAATKTDNGAVARHQGSPFKGQVRMAEDTLVGPCGKKRCADRYDSSESSDSGVAVSCGECSSSGTSDITEPGSPCSTSSDEGVAALRGTSASPLLPTLPKLAPSSQINTRPQWPWTPPLAATACSTTAYKRLRGEPEAGALPRSGAADPTSRGAVKANGKAGQHHHESQGKITEYFKTQIKPQQPKVKKTSEMSVLVAKSSSEFRRPPTVQRNKGGLAKYLGNAISSNRGTSTNDWEMRTLSPSATAKKPPLVVAPRANSKLDKKLPKPLPSLPISNDVLKNLSKISSLRYSYYRLPIFKMFAKVLH